MGEAERTSWSLRRGMADTTCVAWTCFPVEVFNYP